MVNGTDIGTDVAPPRGIFRRSSLRPVMTPIQPTLRIRVGTPPSPDGFSKLDVGQPFVTVTFVAPRQLSRNIGRCESVASCQTVSAAIICTLGLRKGVRSALGVLAVRVFRVSPSFFRGGVVRLLSTTSHAGLFELRVGFDLVSVSMVSGFLCGLYVL